MRYASDVAFTPSVKAIQAEKGSRAAYGKLEQRGSWQTTVTPEHDAFLARLDMFYLGTANAEGQPYIQYRGGPTGFLRAIDAQTLAFADFGGNRQYVTLGNLRDNPQAFLFLMDYEHRQRIKVWGTARAVEDDLQLLKRLTDPAYPGKVERAIVFAIKAWDVNCPQHIHRRLPEARFQAEIARQQREIADLRARLASTDPSGGVDLGPSNQT